VRRTETVSFPEWNLILREILRCFSAVTDNLLLPRQFLCLLWTEVIAEATAVGLEFAADAFQTSQLCLLSYNLFNLLNYLYYFFWSGMLMALSFFLDSMDCINGTGGSLSWKSLRSVVNTLSIFVF
jgi:hypothetical protein